MKTIEIEAVGVVTLRKSRLAKRLILKVNPQGAPVVVMPAYVSYAFAESFARQHTDWLKKNLQNVPLVILHDGKQVGKQHYINFQPTPAGQPVTRVKDGRILVKHPPQLEVSSDEVQAVARAGAIRALRKEAEAVLPRMLYQTATKHGYSYREIRIKNVSSRWGSCSSSGVINLSIWLMQLPDPLIEYVLCHELAHLKHMNHSPSFWSELSRMAPDYTQRKKQLRSFSPRLM